MSNRRLSHSAKNAVLFVILGVLVCAAVLFLLHAWETRQYRLNTDESQYEDNGRDVIYLDGKKYRERNRLETVLVIGLDKFKTDSPESDNAYSNNQQSDFLMLMIIDRDAKTYTPLHINRDTMAKVEQLGVGGKTVGTVTEQLALSHTYGSGGNDSCRNTVKAVSGFLYGIKIDHYLTFSRDAIAKINDLVGGVTVKVVDDFSKVDASLVQGEEIKLTGEQALNYVTDRASLADSSNLARMKRQRQYIKGLKTEMLRCFKEESDFSVTAVTKLSDYLTSDCTLNRLSELISDTIDYEMTDIRTIDGEAVKGKEFMEFYPDEEALKKTVIDLFFEECDE